MPDNFTQTPDMDREVEEIQARIEQAQIEQTQIEQTQIEQAAANLQALGQVADALGPAQGHDPQPGNADGSAPPKARTGAPFVPVSSLHRDYINPDVPIRRFRGFRSERIYPYRHCETCSCAGDIYCDRTPDPIAEDEQRYFLRRQRRRRNLRITMSHQN